MADDLSYENQLLQEWQINDLELISRTGNNLVEDVKDADALTLEYTHLGAEDFASLPRLKIIALQSIGVDEIDIEAADHEGIFVTNAPGFCAYEVASHVMALLLNLSRKISTYHQSVKEGHWAPFNQELSRLKGKTCGLISFGSIAQALVPMLKGFGINVIFYNPSSKETEAKRLGIAQCDSLTQLLNQSDIVSLHTPLTEKTAGMMNDERFAEMKDGAIFINTARGALVDEDALIKHLASNKLSGAGLDVLKDEKNHQSPLIQMQNVVVTPHVGFLSIESHLESKKTALEQIVARLSKDITPKYSVNKNIQKVRA